MDDNLKKLKNLAANMRLSHDEKNGIRRFLEVYSKTYAPVPRMSVWNFFRRPAIAVLGLLLMTGGVALRAEYAIPGDVLYTVKTGVNEKVTGALAVSRDGQLAWEANIQERRFGEAEELFNREFSELEREMDADPEIEDDTADETGDTTLEDQEDITEGLGQLENRLLEEENAAAEEFRELESDIGGE